LKEQLPFVNLLKGFAAGTSNSGLRTSISNAIFAPETMLVTGKRLSEALRQ
jgi:hypothetical protein